MLKDKDQNYYEVLGISKNATKSEIDAAYKAAIRKYHPDIYKGPDADNKMSNINKAYEVLSHSDRRAQYDAFISRGQDTRDFNYHNEANTDGFQQNGFRGDDNFFSNFSFNIGGNSGSDFDFKNIFSSFFGGASDENAYGRSDENGDSSHDIHVVVEITLSEWFNGTTKNIVYEVLDRCTRCVKQKVMCTFCKGKGYAGATIYGKIICNGCGGSGSRDALKLCNTCNQGATKQKTTKSIKILKFMNKRSMIKGAGNFNPRAQVSGNLIIELKILPNEKYKLVNNDIVCNVDIGLEEFIYGTDIKIKYLDNSIININIPPFSELKAIVPKKGVNLNNKYGDLIINLRVKNNIGGRIDKHSFINQFNINKLVDPFVDRS